MNSRLWVAFACVGFVACDATIDAGGGGAGPSEIPGAGGSAGAGNGVPSGSGSSGGSGGTGIGVGLGNGGSGGTGGSGSTPLVEDLCDGTDDMVRRLVNREMNATFASLAGETRTLANVLPESIGEGIFYTNRHSQFLNVTRVADIESKIVGPFVDGIISREGPLPLNQRRVLTCDVALASCTRDILTQFGAKAWRRPLLASEVDALVKVATDAAQGVPLEGLRWALKALMLSPDFLFIIDRVGAGGQLTGPSLASRLSFFLWGETPDAALLKAATDGTLLNPTVYQAQVKRLLADSKATGQWRGNLGGELFGLNRAVPPTLTDPKFAKYQAARPSMEKESDTFMRALLTQNRPIRDVLLSDYSFVDAPLAAFYGVPNPATAMSQVTLPAGRSGILTQPFLTASDHGARNPIFRGVWVFKRLMCKTLVLPDNLTIPPFEGSANGPKTVAEQLKAHQANAACATCHNLIDPVGLAMEELDEASQLRTAYSDGTPLAKDIKLFTGATVSNVRGLAQALLDTNEYESCMLRQMSAYANGTSAEYIAAAPVAAMKATWATKNYGVRDLLETVAVDATFKASCGPRLRH